MIETANDVELWQCLLDLPAASLHEAFAVLSDDEIERAQRYRFERDRGRFVAARAFLRRKLAEQLSVSPRELAFVYGQFGKPGLSHRWTSDMVEFNLSHSEGMAILAITRGLTVGVDLERIPHVPDLQPLASRFFSAHEIAALNALPPEARDIAFYCCWTRKEAFLKALGNGLAHPLDSFDVSLDEDRPGILAIRGDSESPSSWTLFHLRPGPDYVGALAVKGDGVQVTWRRDMAD
jgi:4'-phosphopantetheinyl transferase